MPLECKACHGDIWMILIFEWWCSSWVATPSPTSACAVNHSDLGPNDEVKATKGLKYDALGTLSKLIQMRWLVTLNADVENNCTEWHT